MSLKLKVLDFVQSGGPLQSTRVNLTPTDNSGTGAITIVVINVTQATHHQYDLDPSGTIERYAVIIGSRKGWG